MHRVHAMENYADGPVRPGVAGLMSEKRSSARERRLSAPAAESQSDIAEGVEMGAARAPCEPG